MLKIWKTLSKQTITKNKYWIYFKDTFTINGIEEGEYHYVSTPGSIMIIPRTKDNKIIMVKQYRYLNRKNSLEFPGGSSIPELSKKENGLKELEEETGFTAGSIEIIGEFNPYNGVTDEICTVLLATDLKPKYKKPDETEEFEIHYLTEVEINEKIHNNEIWDGMTLATWMLHEKKIS